MLLSYLHTRITDYNQHYTSTESSLTYALVWSCVRNVTKYSTGRILLLRIKHVNYYYYYYIVVAAAVVVEVVVVLVLVEVAVAAVVVQKQHRR